MLIKRIAKSTQVFGEIAQISSPKSIAVRARNVLKRSHRQQPVAYIIKDGMGKTHKLLHLAETKRNSELNRIIDIYQAVAGVINCPKIVFHNKSAIVAEFIEGDFPSFEDPRFIELFAACLAKLHVIAKKPLDTEGVYEELIANLSYIKSKGCLTASETNALYNICGRMPLDQLETGITYCDHNRGNFIFDAEGRLWLIDLGSFVKDAILDEFVFTGRLKQITQENAFKDAYLNAGGSPLVFKHQQTTKTIRLIRSLSENLKILEPQWWSPGLGSLLPLLDFRLIAARKKNVAAASAALKETVL